MDHILFKLRAYRAFLKGEKQELIDENHCRFGTWFSGNKAKIADDPSVVSRIENYHKTVHQKAKEAIRLWESGQKDQAVKAMREVEQASEVGFEELYKAFLAHRQ